MLNHGAGETEGLGVHADTDYIVAIRDLVGPDIPITVPFDHHGQVTQARQQAEADNQRGCAGRWMRAGQ